MFLGFPGQLNEALKDVEKVVGIDISEMLEKDHRMPRRAGLWSSHVGYNCPSSKGSADWLLL